MIKIKKISGREILDSRGLPTVECELLLSDGKIVKSMVPSGASVGKYEAVELRDNDSKRYLGKGVLKAVQNIEKIIAPEFLEKEPDLISMDKIIMDLDGTENKSNLGANATLAVSMAIARAQAKINKIELFEFICKLFSNSQISIPKVMFNLINGGAHADSKIDFQEFMVMPTKELNFAQNLETVCVIYQNLKKLLQKDGYSIGVGDEGGFAPKFGAHTDSGYKKALDYLSRAVDYSGYVLGQDIVFCLDVAASQFYDEKNKRYILKNKNFSNQGIIELYEELVTSYPIFSIEDGLAEQDYDGWRFLTETLGSKVQLVGDDIFVTNVEKIKMGIEGGLANSVLIKPNQVGTVSQTLDAIKLCKNNNYKTVVSHRSGETIDDFISDLVVGTNSGQFKAGAPVRGERVAKYNRLLEIENKF